jgi:hypothetical protein
MAATCNTVAPRGIAGALTDRVAFDGIIFDRGESMGAGDLTTAGVEGRSGTRAFGGAGMGSAGLAGSAE